MKRGISRFVGLPRTPEAIRRDVDEELRFDVDMRTQDLVREGLSVADARERAVREFGDMDAARRYCEETDLEIEADRRRRNWLSQVWDDVVIAGRSMRRSPVFALVVIVTLALGIGANTAVFSVVRRVLLAPLPYREPDQLYRLYAVPGSPDGDIDKLSAVELEAISTESRLVAGLTMFGNYGAVTYTDGRVAESWQTAQVSPNFFDVLGIKPLIGRSISADDIAGGMRPVVMISDSLWRSVFAADRGVVGRTIRLSGRDFEVIGILPEDFVGPTFTAQALTPLNVTGILRSARMARSQAWRSVVRLRDGATPAAFQSELAVIRARVDAAYPEMKGLRGMRAVPLHPAMVGGAKPILLLVMSGAAIVLIITCVNIAGLFLARATRRRRELSLRAALGAGRGRLVRQLLTESLTYGVAGGMAGVMLAFALKGVVVALASNTLPAIGDFGIDTTVLWFAALVSIACGLGFGLAPAVAATRGDARDALAKGATRGASQGRTATREARALVAAQIAFAVVLAVGAGLVMRTFTTLMSADRGYVGDDRTLTFRVNLPAQRYEDASSRLALFGALMNGVEQLPGANRVGYTAVASWNGGLMNVGFRVDGRSADVGNAPEFLYATASPHFFDVLGVPIRRGRVFTDDDRVGSPPVVVISEAIAKQFWPAASPIGSRVRLGTGAADEASPIFEVVGVVGDVRPSAMGDVVPTVYVAEGQWVSNGGEFVVRTTGEATGLVAGVKQVLHDLDAELPLIRPRTMQQVFESEASRQRLAMLLMGVFALLALTLSSLGVYMVMTYGVVERAREFGIRSALGAGRSTILAQVIREGMTTTVVGVAVGLVAAGVAARFVRSIVVGISTYDPMTFTLAPALLLLVAGVACVVPALTATRIAPVDALRAE